MDFWECFCIPVDSAVYKPSHLSITVDVRGTVIYKLENKNRRELQNWLKTAAAFDLSPREQRILVSDTVNDLSIRRQF